MDLNHERLFKRRLFVVDKQEFVELYVCLDPFSLITFPDNHGVRVITQAIKFDKSEGSYFTAGVLITVSSLRFKEVER